MRSALALFIMLFSSFAWSFPPQNIETFMDNSKSYSIERVISEKESLPWKKATPHEQYGFSKSRIWYHFQVPAEFFKDSSSLILEVPHVYLSSAKLFSVSKGEIISVETLGMAEPIKAKSPIVTGTLAFTLPPAEDYFFSAEADFPMSVPLDVKTPAQFNNDQINRQLIIGVFFGALLFAFLINAFLALTLKSKLYLFYGLYIASISFLFAAHERLSIQLFWPAWPYWSAIEMYVLGGLAILFYFFFVRLFLDTKKNAPWMDRIILALVIVAGIRSIWVLFDHNQTVTMIGQLAIVTINFLYLFLTGVCFYRGVRSAKYFFISSFIFNASYIIFNIQVTNIYYFSPLVEFAAHFGLLSELFLLNYALSDRIRSTNKNLSETVNLLQRRQIEIIQTEKLSALGRMATNIAHEVNNPLAIIYANADLIEPYCKETPIPTDKIIDATKKIANSVKRITNIIKSMRTLSRDSKADPLNEVQLQMIFNDVRTLSQSRFEKAEIDLHFESVPPDIYVLCRETEICQVLINLLNNAFDAVEDKSSKKVNVGWELKGNKVQIYVSDNGAGVPNVAKQNIFEPFYTTKAVGKGIGLGLSVSRSLLEKNNSRIWLEESQAETKFVFSLDIATHSQLDLMSDKL